MWGSGWYYHPARWRTPDGYVPYRVALAMWGATQRLRALGRMEAAQGTLIARMREPDGVLRQLQEQVYPEPR